MSGASPLRVVTGVLTGGWSEVVRAGASALSPDIPSLDQSPAAPAQDEDAESRRKRQEALRRSRAGRSSTVANRGGQGGLLEEAQTSNTILTTRLGD